MDRLRSDPADLREVGIEDRREVGRWLNNHAENFHLPISRKERVMPRFRQMKRRRKVASAHANLCNHFDAERHLISRQFYRIRCLAALAESQTLMA